MTFFRETWRLLGLAAAATIAGSAFIAAPVQAATVNFGNCTSGGNYQSVAVDGSGNFTISCTAAAGPGTVGFASPSTYSATFGQVVAVGIARTGGTAGVVGANLSVTGGCTLSANSVSFPDGSSAAQSVNVTAPGSATTCTVNLAVTGGAVQGTSGATVNVVDQTQPGTFGFVVSQSGPGLNQNFTFTIQRAAGSNGTYDIPFTAVPTGLTGASVTPGSPIRFNSGETTKTLTLATGTTAGSMLITFGTPIPVAPTTAPTTAGGPITITVSGSPTGTCPTPASNVVVLADMVAGEGAHQLINLSPGQIGATKLPTLPTGIIGATITQTQTQGTGDITKLEIGISPCPGDILYGAPASIPGGLDQQQRFGYSPCYTSSSFISNISVAWHLTVAGHYAFCYAPVSTGPWYVNIRYTMPNGCAYGQGNCGASFQWNRR